MLEVKNLTVGYDKPILRNVTFRSGPGELIGILGRNGCGKTTLLRGLSGSVRRFSGQILINGRDCAGLSTKQQASQICVLPQQTEIVEGISVWQLMEMGRYPYGDLFGEKGNQTHIRKNAGLLGITHLLNQDCARLSQGQRQLVLLGRCLIQDTPVMLLDEPNGALDYDNTHTMFACLRQLVETHKKTALVVLHDPELALRYCHRLLIVKGGGICAELSPAQAGQTGVQEALAQIYPNVIVRKDPYDGHFRCYHKESEEHRC